MRTPCDEIFAWYRLRIPLNSRLREKPDPSALLFRGRGTPTRWHNRSGPEQLEYAMKPVGAEDVS